MNVDNTRSYTALFFVPYYAQRLSAACVVHGAAGILGALKSARADRLRARGAPASQRAHTGALSVAPDHNSVRYRRAGGRPFAA